MPKLGRRSDEGAKLEYLWSEKPVTKHAPFGTTDTPNVRVKIIGGKMVTVTDHMKSPREMLDAELRAAEGRNPLEKKTENPHRSNAPPKMAAMTEKPNNFDPTPFVSRKKMGPYNYSSAQQDMHGSHLHQRSRSPAFGQSPLNPHKLLPPIDTGNAENSPRTSYQIGMNSHSPQPKDSSEAAAMSMVAKLPKQGYLPERPIHLTKEEELELRAMVWDDLSGYDPKKLKNIYIELTGFDQHLTGYVSYTDLSFSLLRAQMHLSAMNLRCIASMFVSDQEEGKVNYEKILSFIAACIKGPNQNKMETKPSQKDGVYMNPITHEEEDNRDGSESPRNKKFPYGVRNDAMMLRLIEQQLLDSEEDLDLDHIWGAFRRADRDHRGKLSRKQIKTLAYSCRIPLQESLMNLIIDKCDNSNGQHDWQQFLEYIERVQPQKTGLKIPPSKKQAEFVKHYPQPSNNWPHNSEATVPSKGNRREGDPPWSPYVPTGRKAPEQSDPERGRPPARDRFQPLPRDRVQPPARDPERELVNSLEKELQDLEHSYQHNKLKLEKEQFEQKEGNGEWTDRFMKLAGALYQNDQDNNGYLPVNEMQWLTREYNDVYQLRIPQTHLERAIQDNMDANKVSIDPLLKQLSTFKQ